MGDGSLKDPLLITEWVFLPHQPSKIITMPQELVAKLVKRARARLCTLAVCKFAFIYNPWREEDLDDLLQTNEHIEFAFDSFPCTTSGHKLKHHFFSEKFKLVSKFMQSKKTLKALTIFTDGSGSSRKSVLTWKDPRTQEWDEEVHVVKGSPQIAELSAVVRVFERFQEPLNLVTNSAYVAGIVASAEHALLRCQTGRCLGFSRGLYICCPTERTHSM